MGQYALSRSSILSKRSSKAESLRHTCSSDGRRRWPVGAFLNSVSISFLKLPLLRSSCAALPIRFRLLRAGSSSLNANSSAASPCRLGKSAVFPPTYFRHIIGVDARRRSAGGGTAVASQKMLRHPTFELVCDSDVCHVCVSARSAVQGVQCRTIRQIGYPQEHL